MINEDQNPARFARSKLHDEENNNNSNNNNDNGFHSPGGSGKVNGPPGYEGIMNKHGNTPGGYLSSVNSSTSSTAAAPVVRKDDQQIQQQQSTRNQYDNRRGSSSSAYPQARDSGPPVYTTRLGSRKLYGKVNFSRKFSNVPSPTSCGNLCKKSMRTTIRM